MAKVKDDTLREQQERTAVDEFQRATAGRVAIAVELHQDQHPAADVAMYRVVRLDGKTVRAAIVFAWPGRNKTLFVGTDGARADVVRWLSEHGVPTVRLASF